ncbi:MAG: putative toxin-antitoxin system toxin component, PIN family [Dokdonella sp.]
MSGAIIVDTNVVVAGLLTSREDSPVARILDGMLAAKFPFVISEALLAEYRIVLERQALRKLHGLSAGELETLMITLAEHAILLTPVATLAAPDPGDQHLWELLAAHADTRLVTGDKLLLSGHSYASRVISAKEFVLQHDALNVDK